MTYCTSCGMPIPDGQGSSCSMCYGDVEYGTDGYYREWLERKLAEEEAREQEQIQVQLAIDAEYWRWVEASASDCANVRDNDIDSPDSD